MKAKIGINGLGRIGRMVVRSIFEENRKNLKILYILEKYLKNLYEGITPEKNEKENYYDPIEKKFLDEYIDDPLQIKLHNFHN